MNFISFTCSWIFGLMIAEGVESLQTTSLTTCVTGAISLHGNDPNRVVEKLWWRARYQNGPWVDIGHCVNTKGCTKSPTSSLLPSGTRVWIERNGSLIVERTWTRPGANLNVSQAVEELFSKKDFVEVCLFDANGTQFAIVHSNKGASSSLKYESHSPNAAYWNRLLIERGSLIFPKINEADNGTTIILKALLNSEQTRLGALSTKTMRIFVCNLSEPNGRPHLALDHPSSSSSTTGLNGQATKTSSDLAWYKQLWAIILLSLVPIIIISIVVFVILLIKKKKRRSSEALSSDFP
ncbi:hypothetical protein P5673_002750 [Acropora cervicornis]|uniref:Uncharacterized protein n=1 Tax=Acropora cervicornis TaxID=6130 RepID=A0AAD9R4C2_ACRCE|nr:hypothetical protein P5673_002750 [Acropora cervicornis]